MLILIFNNLFRIFNYNKIDRCNYGTFKLDEQQNLMKKMARLGNLSIWSKSKYLTQLD